MKILKRKSLCERKLALKNKLVRHSSPTSTRSGLCRSPKPKVSWLAPVAKVVSDLRELPEGAAEAFGKEIALLTRVEQVMHEATGLLERPETGPKRLPPKPRQSNCFCKPNASTRRPEEEAE